MYSVETNTTAPPRGQRKRTMKNYEVTRIHSDETEKLVATFSTDDGFARPENAARIWAASEAKNLGGEYKRMGKNDFASVYPTFTVSYHVKVA